MLLTYRCLRKLTYRMSQLLIALDLGRASLSMVRVENFIGPAG